MSILARFLTQITLVLFSAMTLTWSIAALALGIPWWLALISLVPPVLAALWVVRHLGYSECYFGDGLSDHGDDGWAAPLPPDKPSDSPGDALEAPKGYDPSFANKWRDQYGNLPQERLAELVDIQE